MLFDSGMFQHSLRSGLHLLLYLSLSYLCCVPILYLMCTGHKLNQFYFRSLSHPLIYYLFLVIFIPLSVWSMVLSSMIWLLSHPSWSMSLLSHHMTYAIVISCAMICLCYLIPFNVFLFVVLSSDDISQLSYDMWHTYLYPPTQ